MKRVFVKRGDGAVVYVTVAGDTVDAIAHAYYRSHAGTAERVLEANPGLADLGPLLPAGKAIIMPPKLETKSIQPTVRLWD